MTPQASPAPAPATNTPPIRRQHHHRLSFICVNDVYSFDDLDSSGANPRGGWCRAATLMKSLGRKNDDSNDNCDENKNETVLTVANGDVLGGCSLLQYSEGKVAIDVMNSIPVDLAVLGNHEFDYGDEALMERVKESEFSWLGSNVYYPRHRDDDNDDDDNDDNDVNVNGDFQERVVSSKGEGLQDQDDNGSSSSSPLHYFPGIHGNGKIYTLSSSDNNNNNNNLKLGVFGLVTKLTPTISHPSKKVVFDHDILAVARRTARSLRERGAQVIVAITHMSEREDLLLAQDGEAGVDLILGGHEHEPLAKMVHRQEDSTTTTNNAGVGVGGVEQTNNGGRDEKHHNNEGGVLVFKCGMNGYWVGKVDLDIVSSSSEDANDHTTVTSISTSWSMNTVTSRIEEDRTISEITKRYRKKTDESAMISSFGEEVASTIRLDDVVATIGDATNLPLDTRMSSVRRREATGGNLVADAMHWLMKTNIHTGKNDNDKSSTSTMPPITTLAMINGGFIRGDRLYNPGSILTVREILKELPFPRTMKVLEIEGMHLKEAMAQQLRGSSKGPTGAFPHLSSNARLTYELGSSSADSDYRNVSIQSFTVDGLEISDDQKYIIAVTCFVADGNEGCSSWLDSTRIQNAAWDNANMASVLLKYLLCHRVVNPVLEDRVKLVE